MVLTGWGAGDEGGSKGKLSADERDAMALEGEFRARLDEEMMEATREAGWVGSVGGRSVGVVVGRQILETKDVLLFGVMGGHVFSNKVFDG